jgi:hypothetical protein
MSIASLALVSLLAAAAPAPVELGGLKSKPPASWKEVPVSSPMRLKQFALPGKKGEAELVIFFFGQGQGGSAQANLDRWKGQFQPPAGKKLEEVSKVTTTKIGAANATTLDISGTYLFKASPMAPGEPEPRPDHRMLAVVLETPKGNYYLKLVGPAATVEQNKRAFDAWLKAFK